MPPRAAAYASIRSPTSEPAPSVGQPGGTASTHRTQASQVCSAACCSASFAHTEGCIRVFIQTQNALQNASTSQG